MIKRLTYPAVGEITLSKTRCAKRITLSIKQDGSVRLSLPMWVTERRALRFLDEKRQWVIDCRQKMAEKYPPREPLDEAAKAALALRIEALRAEAKRLLPELVTTLAARHGFTHGAVRIKLTRSKWGSCTMRGDINLSLFLMLLPDHLRRYVVLHELCHTVHHNHSGRFHELLDSVTDGRSKALNRELKSYRPEVG